MKRLLAYFSAAIFLMSGSFGLANAATKPKAPQVKSAQAKAAPVKKVAVKGRKKAKIVKVVQTPKKPSYGQLAGLHGSQDPLELRSSVALVVDQDTKEVLFSKNESAVLPIASI
ncbi:MAG: peptidase S11, partial [Rhodoferax sp.]